MHANDSEFEQWLRVLSRESALRPGGSAAILAVLDELPLVPARFASRAIRVLVPHVLARWGRSVEADHDRVEQVGLRALEHVHALLARAAPESWVTLEQSLRPGYYSWLSLAPSWHAISPLVVEAVAGSGVPHAETVLGLLSAHPDGHVRQRALAYLQVHTGSSLAWSLVRTIDWVGAVRAAAARNVRARLADDSALVAHLPLARRLRAFRRGVDSRVLDEYEGAVAVVSAEALRGASRSAFSSVRRGAFAQLFERGLVGTADTIAALRDTDPCVRRAAASEVMQAPSPHGLAVLRSSRSGELRVLGLKASIEHERETARERCIEALSDPNRGVRLEAVSFLTAEGVLRDPAEHYRSAIAAGDYRRGNVAGLGDYGAARDWEPLVAALDASTSSAKEAVVALKRLDRRATRELRFMMVEDERRGVSRAAARSVRFELWSSDTSSLRRMLLSDQEHVAVHASSLAAALPGWGALLLWIALPCEPEHPSAARDAARWFAERQRVLRLPAPADRIRIREAIDTQHYALRHFAGALAAELAFLGRVYGDT